MSSILIRKAELLDGSRADLEIIDRRFGRIAPGLTGDFETVIDGSDLLALPPFYNTHCHAAMTLLRGIADDLELFDWLQHHIWPAEAKLTADAIYCGSRLAALEMIRTGAVFFNDMYFHPAETVRAAEELGLRAAVGMIWLDTVPESSREQFRRHNRELWERRNELSDRIQLTLAPHAVYTVSEASLRRLAELSEREQLPVHIHLAETRREVEECRAAHGGLSPVEYLDRLGLLTPRTLAAHSIHLADSDIERMIARGVTFSYMPCSNYKLSSGRFRFRRIADAGGRITLGTDGCASNNNLSMFDEMKFGALGAKLEADRSTACSAPEILTAATRNGALAFGLDAGRLEPGAAADLLLLKRNVSLMVADHNPVSNVVYSADSSCVDTVICDGRILMRGGVVPGEEEIIAAARACCRRLRE